MYILLSLSTFFTVRQVKSEEESTTTILHCVCRYDIDMQMRSNQMTRKLSRNESESCKTRPCLRKIAKREPFQVHEKHGGSGEMKPWP